MRSTGGELSKYLGDSSRQILDNVKSYCRMRADWLFVLKIGTHWIELGDSRHERRSMRAGPEGSESYVITGIGFLDSILDLGPARWVPLLGACRPISAFSESLLRTQRIWDRCHGILQSSPHLIRYIRRLDLHPCFLVVETFTAIFDRCGLNTSNSDAPTQGQDSPHFIPPLCLFAHPVGITADYSCSISNDTQILQWPTFAPALRTLEALELCGECARFPLSRTHPDRPLLVSNLGHIRIRLGPAGAGVNALSTITLRIASALSSSTVALWRLPTRLDTFGTTYGPSPPCGVRNAAAGEYDALALHFPQLNANKPMFKLLQNFGGILDKIACHHTPMPIVKANGQVKI
ncbi:hypothetical protein FB451DRAFT_1162475 [Mycena latifolia]|nr:hypothetical protein FB451DRAFT_1162475 [Mycena latifolia]